MASHGQARQKQTLVYFIPFERLAERKDLQLILYKNYDRLHFYLSSSPLAQPTTNCTTGTSDFDQNICLKGKNVVVILFQGGARNVSDQRHFILRGGEKSQGNTRVFLRLIQIPTGQSFTKHSDYLGGKARV